MSSWRLVLFVDLISDVHSQKCTSSSGLNGELIQSRAPTASLLLGHSSNDPAPTHFTVCVYKIYFI
jgi:hypothetical protein